MWNGVTGSTLLRGLVDHLLRQLQEATRDSGTSASGWQEGAAAAITVLMEVIYGASVAWSEGSDMLSVAAAGVDEVGRAAGLGDGVGGDTSSELESLVGQVMEDLVRDALWGLPTQSPAGDCAAMYDGPLTPQVRPPDAESRCEDSYAIDWRIQVNLPCFRYCLTRLNQKC